MPPRGPPCSPSRWPRGSRRPPAAASGPRGQRAATAPTTTGPAVTAPPAADSATDARSSSLGSVGADSRRSDPRGDRRAGLTASRATATATRTAPASLHRQPHRLRAAHPRRAPSAGLRIVQALIPYPATRLAEMAAYSLRHSGVEHRPARPDGDRAALHGRRHVVVDPRRASPPTSPTSASCPTSARTSSSTRTAPSTSSCRRASAAATRSGSTTWPSASRWCRRRAPARRGPTSRSSTGRPRWARPSRWCAACRRSTASARGNVIGHAMANAAPQFHDLLGWHNDHGDWQAADVAVFRSRL